MLTILGYYFSWQLIKTNKKTCLWKNQLSSQTRTYGFLQEGDKSQRIFWNLWWYQLLDWLPWGVDQKGDGPGPRHHQQQPLVGTILIGEITEMRWPNSQLDVGILCSPVFFTGFPWKYLFESVGSEVVLYLPCDVILIRAKIGGGGVFAWIIRFDFVSRLWWFDLFPFQFLCVILSLFTVFCFSSFASVNWSIVKVHYMNW